MPSRLALRIYLLGLVQFLVVFAAMEATKHLEQRRLPPFGQKHARYIAEDIAAIYDDKPALDARVQRVAHTLDWTVDVRDGSGRVVSHSEPTRPLPESTRFIKASVPIPLRDGRKASLEYEVHPQGPPVRMRHAMILAVVILVVGVASFLAARAVTRPLAKLTEATRAFGGGKLDARANMRRADEIGEVAAAFDDMADRVARLLLAERELLANVSHELRTPLARIRVAIDLANEAEPAVALETLGGIADDLAELERIVDDVLTAARLAHEDGTPASSPFTIRREPLDMNALLEKSVAIFGATYPARKLSVDIAPDLPTVNGDAVLVRRVVDNLLDNAQKYSKGRDDVVELRAKANGRAVRIEVKDHGIGIARADLDRVFEPFFRADRSRTRTTGGFGLGLALAKRVVDAHRGTIEIESELGIGTTVRIAFFAD